MSNVTGPQGGTRCSGNTGSGPVFPELNSVLKVESGRGRGSRLQEEGLSLGLGPVGLECGDRQTWEEGVER